MAEKPDWDSLPQHLWHLIMRKLETIGSIKSVAVLRLVSKSLHAAFKEHSAIVDCQILEEGDVARMCALMPQMSAFIGVSERDCWIDLKPLSACSCLEGVSIAGSPYSSAIIVDLAELPNPLMMLGLHSVSYDIITLARGPWLASIEELAISKSNVSSYDDSILLTLLPDLKARPALLLRATLFSKDTNSLFIDSHELTLQVLTYTGHGSFVPEEERTLTAFPGRYAEYFICFRETSHHKSGNNLKSECSTPLLTCLNSAHE